MSSASPRVLVLAGCGISADRELAEAFRLAGAAPERVHLFDLLEDPGMLSAFRILALPGGFSFGDHLGAGKVLARLLASRLRKEMDAFVEGGSVILGVGNGFQALVKMGILPNLSGDLAPEVSLIHNGHGLFENRWVPIRANPANHSPWIRGLDRLLFPVRHGEGRFVAGSPETAEGLLRENRIAFFYDGVNPDGSEMDVAGITDRSGRVLGMMPHPEGFLFPWNHPRWTRGGVPSVAAGRTIFENAVAHLRSANRCV